ncbi:MFS transporter [Paenibacillus herberti]|uniref:MFS transporter n=1 Tax=Paenibacillus herberti TaxID=1619309 RepID=A0A229NWL8_9BACL|nr:MFS transporter [Paenibacillus herberti]OXM14366.1 MFS transporter [Paenibacillus herberti]
MNASKPEQLAWKRNITLFLSSQTISLFGSALVQYAIMWHITLSTQSGIMMTISILCGFVPTFLLSPFAGVWADRYNRKLLIITSDSSIAITTLIMALLFMAGYEAFWMLFLMSAIRALGTAVQTPTVGAFIPQLVPDDQLTRINGINGSLQALIMFAAPVASAGLMSYAQLHTIFFIDVVTAAIAVLTLTFLKVKAHASSKEAREVGYMENMKEGIRYIRNHSFLKPLFIFMALFMLLISPAAFLSPLQVARSFGPDVWRLTAIELTFSVGMMAGGILIASWQGFRNKAHTMALGFVASGIATAAMGVLTNFWIYAAMMGVVGVTMPLFNTPATVLLQQKVEEGFHGRVFGIMGMISSSVMPLGMLAFGPLADQIAIEWLMLGSGILIAVVGVLFARNRELLAAGAPQEMEPGRVPEPGQS